MTCRDVTSLTSNSMPPRLRAHLGHAADERIYAAGDLQILTFPSLAVLCSISCPGSVVIKTFDAIRELRDAGVALAGGFHSPMEKECLDFLLRGNQPVVVCLAVGLGRFRIPKPWRTAIETGRLLLISQFGDDVRRTTKVQAQKRNELIAAMAAAVLIPHAAEGGKTESLARSVVQRGQPIFTFLGDENVNMARIGACAYDLAEVKHYLVRDQTLT